MDSLTQAVLGAAVGGCVAGKNPPRRMMLAGAVIATLPDLDVFIHYSDSITSYVSHRGFTHSLLILPIFSLILATITIQFLPRLKAERMRIHALFFFCLITHPLLDSFTSYGTQLFWPLPLQPISWSSIFIIDPLYTLPMLLAIIICLFLNPARRMRVNHIGMLISALYLGSTLFSKAQFNSVVAAELDSLGVSDARVYTTPTPFNTFVWRAVVMDGDRYFDGIASPYFPKQNDWLKPYPINADLIRDYKDNRLEKLQWFTRGFIQYDLVDNILHVTDLRLGMHEALVFSFKIAEYSNGGLLMKTAQRIRNPRDIGLIWPKIRAAITMPKS